MAKFKCENCDGTDLNQITSGLKRRSRVIGVTIDGGLLCSGAEIFSDCPENESNHYECANCKSYIAISKNRIVEGIIAQ